jgi:methylmalonyl-CoA/ethylmalonyl-CoA epimerase
MMPPKIAHIGVAIRDLDEATAVWEKLFGLRAHTPEEVTDQKVMTAVFPTGGAKIELLAGTAPDSPIAKFIERRGPGIHHICVEVDDLVAELERLKKEGFRLIDEIPRRGAQGRLIAFVHPSATAGILVELQQKS